METTPEEDPIVAELPELMLHVPPVAELPSVVFPPIQTAAVPVMADGGLTVTTAVT